MLLFTRLFGAAIITGIENGVFYPSVLFNSFWIARMNLKG